VKDMYLHPSFETASRPDLQRLQQERLQETVRQAAKAPFYCRRFGEMGLRPEQIHNLEDLRAFGFTTKQDLRENYPYGLLAVSRDDVVRVHVSSGTTGTPTAICHTRQDLERWSDIMARSMYMVGLRKSDVLQNMMTYGMFTGGLGVHYGAEKLGMMVLPTSAGNTERQIRLIKDFGTTALHITPTYALHLISVLAQMGIEPRSLGIHYAIIGGEPCSATARKKLEQVFGFRTVNCFGLSEMSGPGVGFECPTDGALHLWEDHYIVEIIDPDSGQPLPDGQEGEMVLTTLQREAMPLLRYRTRDLTRIIPEKCRCGRTHIRIEPIKARSDDMLILGGVNVYPSQVEQVLMAVPEVGNNWVMVLTKKESLDKMTIRVEIKPEAFSGDPRQLHALRDRIMHAVKGEILINPQVELLEPGSLPEMMGKAKRVIDQRKESLE
jgi:phenylacetate-CoA ligase